MKKFFFLISTYFFFTHVSAKEEVNFPKTPADTVPYNQLREIAVISNP